MINFETFADLRDDHDDGKPNITTLRAAVDRFNNGKRGHIRQTARDMWAARERRKDIKRGKYAT